jgi:large subunit ribosomal protein L18|tara:strand:+ start:1157 stop:1519 length:363 start_codon:yes stop_codon:yes gene_type:complete
MKMIETRNQRRARRNRHAVKAKANGRLRLSVFRSNEHIYAQVIDDTKGVTLAQASTVDKALKAELKTSSSTEAAVKVGELVAKRAIEAGVKEVFFDRGRFVYHGRVQALADAARSGGLQF